MTVKDIDMRFLEAIENASKMTQASIPQDIQLRLYAFYKQATFGSVKYNQTDHFDLRNAFKTNAWIQISHYSTTDAKEEYIKIINELMKK